MHWVFDLMFGIMTTNKLRTGKKYENHCIYWLKHEKE